MTKQAIIDNIEEELDLGRWFIEMGGKGSGHWRHRGRKGKRGGTAPSKGRGLSSKKLSAPIGERGRDVNFAVEEWMEESVGRERGFPAATDQERARLKERVGEDLAESAGVSVEEADNFIMQWAHSSNDDDMRSLAVQQDAAKEFGVELSEFTKTKVIRTKEINEKRIKAHREELGWTEEQIQASSFLAMGLPLMESDKQRALLRSMYNETQAELKSRGITEVRLSRGVKLDRSIDPKLNKPTGISTNAVESWSISRDVAREFAMHYDPGQRGVVFESIIPAERILSVPATGFGCLTEGEVIVIGGVEGDIATVSDRF